MHPKKLQKQFFFCLAVILCALFFGAGQTHSQEFTSVNYTVLDPVMNAGGYGTSTNFGLLGVISQVSNGQGTSATFGNNAGFLYYPYASSPSVSATPGSGQVSLSWTASVGYLGWTPSGYDIGQSTVSGGPYSYTSLGNVTSGTRTGLSNGTPYYFVIVVKDAFNNAIASSSQVSAIPVAAVVPPSGGGGGSGSGGGGGIITPPATSTIPVSETNVEFSGRAYPMSKVSILKDGQLVLKTIAGPDSNFFAKLSGLSAGNYNFSVYGEDKNGIRGSSFTFPIYITAGVTTRIGGIFLAPTISVDKSEVLRGDNIAIFGQSAPNAQITINVNSDANIFVQQKSDKNGVYLLNFDSAILELGAHSAKSKQALGGEISQFGNTVGFKVGTKNIKLEAGKCPARGDLNADCRVNLVDFSIAAYWYKRPLSVAFKKIEKERLNGDGKIDLTDFSIMAYYWSG
jgi:hypothetical protein